MSAPGKNPKKDLDDRIDDMRRRIEEEVGIREALMKRLDELQNMRKLAQERRDKGRIDEIREQIEKMDQ